MKGKKGKSAQKSITLILSLRRRWGRMLSAAAACCLLAWTLSGVVGAA